MRKKLGWFRKQLGNIGKRIFWLTQKKMNLYVLSLMQKEVFLKYTEILGDQQLALETFKAQFTEGANFMLQNLWEGKTFSKIKFFISESLEDFEFLGNFSMYAILGQKAKEFMNIKLVHKAEGEERATKFIIETRKCVCCAAIDDEIHHEELEGCGYIDILMSTMTSLFQMILDYMAEDKYITEFKETKCYLRGDSCGETEFIIRTQK